MREFRGKGSGQRAAFDKYANAFHREFAGVSTEESRLPGDLLQILYRTGAKEDLSNVVLSFIVVEGPSNAVGNGSSVNIKFWITKSDGTLSPSFGSTFARL